MDRTFFDTCPECKSLGPHHAEFHERIPPPPDYPVETEEIVSFGGQVVRTVVTNDGSFPSHTDYECTMCKHRWSAR